MLDDDRDLKAELSKCLETELTSALALLALLERERHALRGRDPHILAGIIEEKSAAVTEMRAAGAVRDALLDRAGVAKTASTLSEIAARLDAGPSGALSALVGKLVETARSVRLQNEVNGRIVEVSHHAVDWLVGTLRGVAEPPQVYGPGGRQHLAGRSVPIARV